MVFFDQDQDYDKDTDTEMCNPLTSNYFRGNFSTVWLCYSAGVNPVGIPVLPNT